LVAVVVAPTEQLQPLVAAVVVLVMVLVVALLELVVKEMLVEIKSHQRLVAVVVVVQVRLEALTLQA
jgi:hypothetical protein